MLTNPLTELDGLLFGLATAVGGGSGALTPIMGSGAYANEIIGYTVANTVISRSITLRNRDYDEYWPGPYPLILMRDKTFTLARISGGQLGEKGQQGQKQNGYRIEIHDVVDLRDPGAERVAAAQTDILTIQAAMLNWFDHLPNQSLPVSGSPTCYRAGEYINFENGPPFRSVDGGEVRLVKVGDISVIGAPRPQQAT